MDFIYILHGDALLAKQRPWDGHKSGQLCGQVVEFMSVYGISMIKFDSQDIEESQRESVQRFEKDLSEIEDNLSKLETRVQDNTERDSEVSQHIEGFQNEIRNSSAILNKSVEKLKEDTTSNLEQLKSLKNTAAQNLEKITSNANALKVGL